MMSRRMRRMFYQMGRWPMFMVFLFCFNLGIVMADGGGGGGDDKPLISFREYQKEVASDHVTKTVLIHWSRQIGKSFTLACWAVDRLLLKPGRLVTVLSNSKDNGAEFALKCREVCEKLQEAYTEIESIELDDLSPPEKGMSQDEIYNAMNFEVKVKVKGKVGRIKVLAANPRTARGFSGDLILDEFAFHEDSIAIWDAAEPIISGNPDFLCRIASTGNGKRNMFYQLIADGRYKYSKMPRSKAYEMGLKIYSSINGQEITPDEARSEAADKASYDQNYECAWNDENMMLLTQELINIAQRVDIAIDQQEWSETTIERMAQAEGKLYLGQDVGREKDLSVQWVLEKVGHTYRTIGVLVMRQMRLPAQKEQLKRVLTLPNFAGAEMDMTGLGLGLVEFAQDDPDVNGTLIHGVNFASTEPVNDYIKMSGRKAETARVTEIMATDLVEAFEDRLVEIPASPEIRDDLRKPEKITSPGGQVSIAASRDGAGHADMFWALALAVRATKSNNTQYFAEVI